jgi:sugar-phosphatase
LILSCEAVIFDLDGVLIDSTAVVERVWEDWATQIGMEPAALMAVAHGRRSVDTIRLVAPHLDAEAEAHRLEGLETSLSEGLGLIPGAPQLINSLPDRQWAVVTSGMATTATARLAFAGLPIPQVLVTGNDVQHGKPDPQGYRLAAERLGTLPANCIVIEDAPAGISAAKAAGMKVIAVMTTHAASELTDADVRVSRLSELTILPAEQVLRGSSPSIQIELASNT